jgi:competence protein ComGC
MFTLVKVYSNESRQEKRKHFVHMLMIIGLAVVIVVMMINVPVAANNTKEMKAKARMQVEIQKELKMEKEMEAIFDEFDQNANRMMLTEEGFQKKRIEQAEQQWAEQQRQKEQAARLALAGATSKAGGTPKVTLAVTSTEPIPIVSIPNPPYGAAPTMQEGSYAREQEDSENQKWAWIVSNLEQNRAKDLHNVRVQIINNYLAGSPMSGLGEIIVENAERTGVIPYICPVQAYAESSLGACLCGSYNPFGMIGCGFGSWQEAIASYFNNVLVHWGAVQDAHQLTGYCVPDYPYLDNISNVVNSMKNQEQQIMNQLG